MPVRSVKNSDDASSGEAGRRWLKKLRMGAFEAGINRTRRPLKRN